MKKANTYLLIFLTLALAVFFSLTTDHFFSAKNFLSITEHMAEFGIMSMGMMLTILVSGIDLTVSSICGLTSLVIITLIKANMPIGVAIIIAMIVAVAFGTLTGLFVAKLGVPPMLLTLAMSMLIQGISYVISEGNAISGYPESYFFIGQGEIAGIPAQTILLIIVVALMTFLLKCTPWGLKIYAVGSNANASTYCGISVVRIKMSAYMLSALLSSIAGIVMSSRVATARLDLGTSYQTNCIAAAVLGGTSLSGGEGSPIGTLLGVAIFSMLSNGFNHLGVSSFIQQLIIGVTLVVVVIINTDIIPMVASKKKASAKND